MMLQGLKIGRPSQHQRGLTREQGSTDESRGNGKPVVGIAHRPEASDEIQPSLHHIAFVW